MLVRPLIALLLATLLTQTSEAQVISGVVRDSKGNNLEKARVSVISSKGGKVGSTFTASDGTYSISVPNASGTSSYFVNVYAHLGADGKDRKGGVANNVFFGSSNSLVLNFIPGDVPVYAEMEDNFVTIPHPPGKGGDYPNDCPDGGRDRCRIFNLFRRCR